MEYAYGVRSDASLSVGSDAVRSGAELSEGIERARLALSNGKAAALAYSLGVSIADIERLGGVSDGESRSSERAA